MGGLQLPHHVGRAVGRGVVHDEDVHVVAQPGELLLERGDQRRDVVTLVVGRDDDDDFHGHRLGALANATTTAYSVDVMPARLLTAIDSPLSRRMLFGGVIVTVLLFAVLAAHWRPLWYDELFTLYVASEPTTGDVLRALLHGADTNPPLDYLLRHASLAAFGDSSVAFRWPSAAAFVAGQLAIFAYVRRRAPFLAAAGAALLPRQDSPRGFAEGFAPQTQARVHSSERDLEHGSDVIAGHSFQFEKRKDRPLLETERVQ